MRIVVFSHNLTSAGGRSVGVNLVRALSETDSEHEFLMVTPPGDDYQIAAEAENVAIHEMSVGGSVDRLRWEHGVAPQIARDFRADWIVALGNIPVVVPGIRSAVLFHDPHLFYDPSTYRYELMHRRARKAALRWYLRRSLPSVDVVLTQTAVASRRVRETYGVESTEILPNAVSTLLQDGADAELSVDLPDASFRFLTLTRYYPHKNLETLVEMFERHGDALNGVAGLLTIHPDQHPGARRLLRRISKLGLEERLVNLGPLEQRALPGIYRAVDAMVLPTLLESFSGTYVESMSLGVPIVTSERDFARAVCGNAALYVDPHDPGAIASAITRLRNDARVGEALVDRGFEQARQFQGDWPEIAATLIRALESRTDAGL